MTREELGRCIRNKRKRRGITQEKLCKRVEIDRSNLSKIECGHRNAHKSTLALIARGIGCELAELFREE